MAQENEVRKSFDINLLSKQEKKDLLFVKDRILKLQEVRQDHYGVNLDTLWADADRDYTPHRLKTKSKKVVATDEDKGWRGALVTLGSNDWQSDISRSNVFIKVQVALSILIDQNPKGVFTPILKKFRATNELIKQLYQRSWEYARSKGQLVLFVFNLAKYGWAVARTYPLRIVRKVRILKEIDPDNPSENVYEDKEVVEYNDVFRENLDPRNAWIDDMAKPNNHLSLRDWAWRKVYDFQTAEDEFGKYPFWKYVQPGGVTTDVIGGKKTAGKEYKDDRLLEIYFYENRQKDLFVVLANNVPIIMEPLPISDSKGIKKLSCWQTYWNLRHSESPYGVGIYESIKYDQATLDRFRNMTIDQLALSIYKMWFYQGTQALTETGDIKIAPGVGRQVLDPKNIAWLEVPGPGREAWEGLDRLQKDVDEDSAIGDPLLGVVTGKTAFELAQAKEAALKRLKNPLNNILEALTIDGYLTISLMQLIYSVPETYKIADEQLINDYLKEIESDSDLYERDEEGSFTAKVYPEFPLNLEKDEKGNLVETQDTRFFRIKPSGLEWEGIINIKPESILSPSQQIDKAMDMEMYNILIPLLANPPQLYSKIAKSIIKRYDKDPRDILPDEWLSDQSSQEEQPLIVPQEQVINQATATPVGSMQGVTSTQEAPRADRFVSNPQLAERPQGFVQKFLSRFINQNR